MSLQEEKTADASEQVGPAPRPACPKDALSVRLVYVSSKEARTAKADSLQASSVITANASQLARDLQSAIPKADIRGACVRPVGDDYETIIDFESKKHAEPTLDLGVSELHEAVLAALHDLVNAATLLKVSDDVARRVAAGEVVGRPEVKPAKSSQKEQATSDLTGTIWVKTKNPIGLIKKARKTLALAGCVNARGYSISLHFEKQVLALPSIRHGSTKAEWIVTEEQSWTSRCSGIVEQNRMVEVWHEDKVHFLSVPTDDAGRYAEAYRTGKWVNLTVEESRPSNPLLPDEPKFRISDTHGVVDVPGQIDLV